MRLQACILRGTKTKAIPRDITTLRHPIRQLIAPLYITIIRRPTHIPGVTYLGAIGDLGDIPGPGDLRGIGEDGRISGIPLAGTDLRARPSHLPLYVGGGDGPADPYGKAYRFQHPVAPEGHPQERAEPSIQKFAREI